MSRERQLGVRDWMTMVLSTDTGNPLAKTAVGCENFKYKEGERGDGCLDI